MKLTNRSLVLGTLLSIFASSSAFAGFDVGNGGDGVNLNGRITLLDFLEEGVDEAPYLSMAIAPNPAIMAAVNEAMPDIDAPREMIAKKLTEIYDANRTYGQELLAALSNYSWVLVKPDLVNVPDEDTALDYHGLQMVQLAVRTHRTIRISREAWMRLDMATRTGLVMHEIVYASLLPRQTSPGVYLQYSPIARQLVGQIFSDRFRSDGALALHNLAEGVVDWNNEYGTFEDGNFYRGLWIKAEYTKNGAALASPEAQALSTDDVDALDTVSALCHLPALSETPSAPSAPGLPPAPADIWALNVKIQSLPAKPTFQDYTAQHGIMSRIEFKEESFGPKAATMATISLDPRSSDCTSRLLQFWATQKKRFR
ncbi:MAG: hypothetical protein JST16_10805 [Bdellovibrionales bacterium]|nr:hypothetical protein [Bdellovibrionales bacterium]